MKREPLPAAAAPAPVSAVPVVPARTFRLARTTIVRVLTAGAAGTKSGGFALLEGLIGAIPASAAPGRTVSKAPWVTPAADLRLRGRHLECTGRSQQSKTQNNKPAHALLLLLSMDNIPPTTGVPAMPIKIANRARSRPIRELCSQAGHMGCRDRGSASRGRSLSWMTPQMISSRAIPRTSISYSSPITGGRA
jgi:hypothetical protein